ncbi:hypothetical protein H6P81_001476 [Aristolochia fimbriata]|uniref:non-specific serine/threonine protein kinase n=1 Tax=Aristolochia fimbriata TaxID=158543 RepID=A0AAV7F7A7_ARIFI|nr:hypothetical protein H6P81_001476 [Aristolochia fimbriata]
MARTHMDLISVSNMVPFVLLTLLSLVSTCKSSSLISDGLALSSLRQGLDFAGSPLVAWETSNLTTVCSWAGIGCENNRVVSLDFSNLNLTGSVSPVITRLGSLVELNISNNQFTGSLDWDFSALPNLQVFDAYNNNFTGLLPLGVSTLAQIRYLDLGGNYFEGKIPSEYGDLLSLEYLGLEGNELDGRIPGELGNLLSLRELYLGYYNVFEGGIPAQLGNMVNLVHLDLSSCGLDGQLPHQLGQLQMLDTLYLHANLLSGPIPKELGNLTNLVNLDLSNNALTGEIPPQFINLQKLSLLNLFMNRLHGSIPDFVAELPNLQTLSLWSNNFTGVIPERLGMNQNLQVVDLSSNKLTGTIPQGLCSSNQLKVLILFKNFLFGPIPERLGSCVTLTRVRLGQNYLNGTIPNRFLYLPEVHLMELHNNYLSGTLQENENPSLMPSKLGELNLSNNLLSGSLPSSVSNFRSLQILLLNQNQFTGRIPPSIGELRQILKLDLSRNAFSDQIPPQISNCSHLTYLDLSQNNFSGPIPPEISQNRILNYMNLSHNHLNESIPKSIGVMKSLTVADFSFNDLSGRLPEIGQFAYFNASSFAGNPRLCGPVLNNPCNLSSMGVEPRKVPADFKLVFALGLLMCSLVFAAVAVAKARSLRRSGGRDSWKMTTFQKVGFAIGDVLESMKDSNVIGRGGAGIVYLGKMPNGDEIAVKKLLGFGSHSHDHGFRAEIETLGNIKHRNIVRLLAFCSNSETNVLVYEYMRNGSLGEALHGKRGGFLGWDLRYKIAVEAARGLCYLHHDCSPLIVHRDVKSNNILLNSSFEAHVADFGLAKFLQDGGTSECMSAIAGSYGYIAPEYAYTLKVDEKSDVYSFGVVLLELITGRRPVGDFGDGVDIVQWARGTTRGHKRDEIGRIVDPRLTVVPKEEAAHLFFVGSLCIHENSVERPTMREVVQMLSEFPRHASSTSPSSSSSSSMVGPLQHRPSNTGAQAFQPPSDLLM